MHILRAPHGSRAAPGLRGVLCGGARIIGDINDPHSRISRMLHEHHDTIKVLKPESGTSPHVFYLGLDDAFVTPLMGRAQPALWQEV